MDWVESLKMWEAAPVGAYLTLPEAEVTLQISDKLGARLLLFLQEWWPQGTVQEWLGGLESAVFWLTLMAGLPQGQSPLVSPPKAEEVSATPVVRLDLDSRTAKMLDRILQEHAGKAHFTGRPEEVRRALELAGAKAHRHYPDGRPDCATCRFFNLVGKEAA
jgi:hypothetical protein